MEYLCRKFGDFIFGRFGFIVRTVTYTDADDCPTHTQRWIFFGFLNQKTAKGRIFWFYGFLDINYFRINFALKSRL